MTQNNHWTDFQMPTRLEVEKETLTDRYGKFYAQPFERGFGTTIGNSLRRALLSSIEGAAITAVKIEGVEHEFSSIKGVVEDATDVILNLKQIPFKLHGTTAKTLTISKSGAGEVTSADLEADGDVEILDTEVHIATIGAGGDINIEMRLKSGRGYVSAEFNNDDDLSLGYIPIDSVHTPIKKVNSDHHGSRRQLLLSSSLERAAGAASQRGRGRRPERMRHRSRHRCPGHRGLHRERSHGPLCVQGQARRPDHRVFTERRDASPAGSSVGRSSLLYRYVT
jgi:hypothetical protein